VRGETHADRYLALLDAAEEIGGLGAWEWYPQTGELQWSDNHFRLFGFEPQSVVPSVDLVLENIHPDDRDRVAAVVAGATPENALQDVEYRIVRSDGAIRHFRVTVSVVDHEGGEATRIVGSVQDFTERRAAERTIAARIAVSEVLERWPALGDEAMPTLLARVGEAMQFAFGVLLVTDDGYLVARATWTADDERFAAVAADLPALRRPLGGSDSGRAWTSREPLITPFVPEARPRSALRDAATASRVRTTVAIPVATDDETLAVLTFVSLEDVEPTEAMVRSLVAMGHELGHFFRSRRGELSPTVLTPRLLEVLQLAADGLTGPAIAERLHLSPSTIKRHFEEIYTRLGVSDRAAAVAVAMRRGLIS
jgi:PAS domain S-box-containing protein